MDMCPARQAEHPKRQITIPLQKQAKEILPLA
jgi:hypothetical protein